MLYNTANFVSGTVCMHNPSKGYNYNDTGINKM